MGEDFSDMHATMFLIGKEGVLLRSLSTTNAHQNLSSMLDVQVYSVDKLNFGYYMVYFYHSCISVLLSEEPNFNLLPSPNADVRCQ